MRDDFEVANVRPMKVALSSEQVEAFKLPPIMTAKQTSSRYDKFVDRHGNNVFELEALPPAELQRLLRNAIESVIDQGAFDDEVAAERDDAAFMAAVRKRVTTAIGDLE
jgi:hypothetical protein